MSLDELNVRVGRIAIRSVIITNVRQDMSCSEGRSPKVTTHTRQIGVVCHCDALIGFLLLMEFLPRCGEVSLVVIDWTRRGSDPCLDLIYKIRAHRFSRWKGKSIKKVRNI
jgi:thiamine kinase-like enzyme